LTSSQLDYSCGLGEPSPTGEWKAAQEMLPYRCEVQAQTPVVQEVVLTCCLPYCLWCTACRQDLGSGVHTGLNLFVVLHATSWRAAEKMLKGRHPSS